MAKPISKSDAKFFRMLEERQALTDIDPTKIDFRKMIVVTCPDGHHFIDIIFHLMRVALYSYLNTKPPILRPFYHAWFVLTFLLKDMAPILRAILVHPLSLNGGGLLLSPDWPTQSEAEVLVEHIRQTMQLKGSDCTIVTLGHFVCGAAAEVARIDTLTAIEYLVSGQERLRELFPQANVQCFAKIYWPDQRRRTKMINIDVLRAALSEQAARRAAA